MPNDQLVVDENMRLRTSPVAPDAAVRLTLPLLGRTPPTRSRATSPGVAGRSAQPQSQSLRTHIPFAVTDENGVVVRIDQLYVP